MTDDNFYSKKVSDLTVGERIRLEGELERTRIAVRPSRDPDAHSWKSDGSSEQHPTDTQLTTLNSGFNPAMPSLSGLQTAQLLLSMSLEFGSLREGEDSHYLWEDYSLEGMSAWFSTKSFGVYSEAEIACSELFTADGTLENPYTEVTFGDGLTYTVRLPAAMESTLRIVTHGDDTYPRDTHWATGNNGELVIDARQIDQSPTETSAPNVELYLILELAT